MPLPGMSVSVGAMGALNAISLSATWNDITIASPTAQSTNSNVTLTWSGSSRTIAITHGLTTGSLEYRINSGTYTSCPTGTSFSMTSGQTLNFRYSANGTNDSVTVTVTDASRGSSVDAFNVASSGF